MERIISYIKMFYKSYILRESSWSKILCSDRISPVLLNYEQYITASVWMYVKFSPTSRDLTGGSKQVRNCSTV